MMKHFTAWFTTMLIILVVVVKCCFAQTSEGAVISNSPAVSNLQGVGINLYSWTFWDASADYLQNILQNPGFEPSTSGRVVIVPAGATSTTFCDKVSWFPMSSGFYNGATFEDVYVTGSGSNAIAASRGNGTITAYNPTGCASSTPQFTYSASFAIQAGDYVRFHAAGNMGNIGYSTYAPVGWWNSDANITLVSDKEPNSNGVQALDIALNGSSQTVTQYQDAGPANYTGSHNNWIQVTGPWTVSCWAKAVNAASPSLTLSFGRIGSPTYFNQAFTPTSSWAQYSNTFIGPETSLTSKIVTAQFQITGNGTSGDIRVDDCFVGPTVATTSPWSSDMSRAIKKLNPGFIRDNEGTQGDSYANFVADDTARGPSSPSGSGFTWQYNVDQFFKLNAAVGSTPWVVIPVVMTDSEYRSLGSYLAAEETIYGFSQIIIEWGNEMWNGGSCGGSCYAPQGDQYSAVAKRDFSSVLAGAGVNSGNYLKWAAGGQYGAYPPGTGQIATVQTVANTATYISGAPYYLYCLDTQTSTADDMSILFGDDNLQESYMDKVVGVLANQGQYFAAYEGGPSTWWGSASNSERNGTIAGAGSAASDAELALNLWSAGTPVINMWNLAQTVDSCSGASCPNSSIGTTCTGTPPSPMSADIWGVVHDLPTGLLRPRGLAIELLNNYFLTSRTGSFYPSSSSTYTGVAVGAWHDSHNLWNVAIVNSNPSSQNVVVQFPTTTGLPAGTVKQINYTSSITDINESSPLVTIGNGAQVIAGPSSNQVTIPVPAYGLVVAQGDTLSPTPTATPTAIPTATPTAVPTATPTAAPTATPTAVPTATPMPTPTAAPTPTPNPTATPTPTPVASTGPVTVTPSWINFGYVAGGTTSSVRTILMINQYANSAPLVIGQVSIGGSGDFAIVPWATSCTIGSTLPPNGRCQIAVTFTPSTPGWQSAPIAVIDNASNSPHSVTLVGFSF